MKPLKPYLATIQVPLDILFALSKRKLTNAESRIVMAVCASTETIPGRALVTLETLAKTLGTRKEIAHDLARHAEAKNIIHITKSDEGHKAWVLSVNPPSLWCVPG